MNIIKFLPFMKKVLDVFKKKVESNEELKVQKLKLAHLWLMGIGTVLGIVIVADNIFKIGVGSYIYDMFQIIIDYFIS